MKRILIIVGVVIILLVVAVWIYLFMFGRPDSVNDVFTNFTSDDTSRPQLEEEAPTQPNQPITTASVPFKKITNRAVAGATFVDDTARFVERGTGHVYDVSLDALSEEQSSVTTVPNTFKAVFSEVGNRIAFIPSNDSQAVKVGTVTRGDSGSGIIDSTDLPPNIHSVDFLDDGEAVNYAISTGNGTVAYTHNLLEKTRAQVFTTPPRDTRVLWGTSDTYVITRPTYAQPTGFYRISDTGASEKVSNSVNGQMVDVWGDMVMSSRILEGRIFSEVTIGNYLFKLPIGFIPEKCVGDGKASTSVMYCAGSNGGVSSNTFPDDWYQGKTSLTDKLWIVNPIASSVTEVHNLGGTAGMEFDTIDIVLNETADKLLLINKVDHSLWVYDTTVN